MVAIRQAATADATVIARLLKQLGYPCSGEDVTVRLGYWLGDPASRVLLAERDGLVIGCLSLHGVPYLERTGRWARIESLVVDETARGTGTGRALLEAAEDVARQWGCLAVEVTSARARAGAWAFYHRMGYTDVCGRSGRYMKALRPGSAACHEQ
jgi:GNAT superfamily N-acetyltransferase